MSEILMSAIANSDLESRHALFAIDCYRHVVSLYDPMISELLVNGETLNQYIEDWLQGKQGFNVETNCKDPIACNPMCDSYAVSSQ